MADRYWVGGTASWDGTAGTKWATTSGGGGGASVPTSADAVFFTNLSTGTCTIATGNTGAQSINCTGFTGTITGTASISVAGSITLVAGQTYTHTGTVTLTGTGTLTTAGKTFSGVTIDGVGITVTLGDALNIGGRDVTVTNGTFTTSASNYNVTAQAISSSNSNTRTITLNGSTVTLSGGTNVINFSTSTNLTFNAGTSQINITSANPTINVSSQTFYNVSFTSTSAGTRSITGANTFNDLSLTASALGLSALSLAANQTVNGTFTCAGTSATRRGFVRSDTIGTTRTITANAISANDCDFRDITLAGTAAGASPTRAGDCGNNSGITFPAAKTVYWNLAGTQNWNATAWATTSNGTPAVNNFPLAQDTATFTDSGSAGTISLSTAYNTGTIDASGRTSAMSINHNASHNIYGSYTLGSGVTVSGTSAQTFAGRGTQTFTSAGKTVTFPITVDKAAGAFELGDAFNSSSSLTLTRGTLDAKNYNLTCTTFDSNNSNTRIITMGSGLWTLSGTGTVWNTPTTTGLTFNKDTANILLSDTSTTGRNFTGGNLTYNKLTIGGTTGTSTSTISGSNTFSELASTKTVAHTINFNDARTITTWSVTGTAGNVVTVNSAAAGTRRTINLTNATSGIDYLSVKDIGVSTTNKFYVGANSTDGGNNLNVYFTAAPGGITLFGSGSVNGTATVTGLANYTTSSSGSMAASATVSSSGSLTFSVNGAINGTGTVSALGSLTQSGIGYINGTASVSALGGLLNIGQASITANGTVTANGGLLLIGQASVDGTATVTADGYYIADGVAAISAFADVTALANYTTIGTAVITANGTVIANGVIQGEGWNPITPGTETWTTITAGTETWTDISPSTDIWLRQG